MYLASPTNEAALAAIKDLDLSSGKALLLLIGEKSPINVDELIKQLSKENLIFIGAVFPSIISGDIHSDSGVVLQTLPILGLPYLIRDLDKSLTLPAFEDELDASEEMQLTAIIWIDGLTRQISSFLAELYSTLGNSVRYLGGGAGSLSLEQRPCLFTQEGYFQDAAIVLFSPLEIQLGVRHGWQRLHGPLPATKTCDTAIAELSWRNAFEVYQGVVDSDSQQTLTQQNFFDIAKAYPFGIFKEGQEDIVRDPILVSDSGDLICVGDVPENALLYILKGNKYSLISSAHQAATEAVQGVQGRIQRFLVIDCISRVLFLGDRFSEELAAFRKQLLSQDSEIAVEGVLTLGEISSYGEGFLEFFNKTIVVGAFYK